MRSPYRLASLGGQPLTHQRALAVVRSCVASALVLAVFAGTCWAKSSQALDPSTVEARVKKFGVGKDVKVRLTDGERVRGHIGTIRQNSFTVRTANSSQERQIPYDQVSQIKDPGPITWMLIGAAAVVIIILVVR